MHFCTSLIGKENSIPRLFNFWIALVDGATSATLSARNLPVNGQITVVLDLYILHNLKPETNQPYPLDWVI